jgi:hypothetical protein
MKSRVLETWPGIRQPSQFIHTLQRHLAITSHHSRIAPSCSVPRRLQASSGTANPSGFVTCCCVAVSNACILEPVLGLLETGEGWVACCRAARGPRRPWEDWRQWGTDSFVARWTASPSKFCLSYVKNCDWNIKIQYFCDMRKQHLIACCCIQLYEENSLSNVTYFMQHFCGHNSHDWFRANDCQWS